MAWVQSKNGTTTTDGTEQTLFDSIAGADSPINAVFQFCIDTVNMAAGDGITVRIYKKIVGGTTGRVLYKQSYSGAQPVDDLIKISAAIGASNGLKVTLKRDLGTDRAYLWEVITA